SVFVTVPIARSSQVPRSGSVFGWRATASECSQVSQRSTRRQLRAEQRALRHSVRGAVHLSMRRVLGTRRNSTTSALELCASATSLCQSASFGHAQSYTGCLTSPQFVRSRHTSAKPRHDRQHELTSRTQDEWLCAVSRAVQGYVFRDE